MEIGLVCLHWTYTVGKNLVTPVYIHQEDVRGVYMGGENPPANASIARDGLSVILNTSPFDPFDY